MQIQVKLNKNLDFDFLTFWGHVTSSFTLADSYIHQSATTAGAAAELAAARKVSKYDDIPASFMFQPVALETLGPSYQRVSHSFCGGFGPQNFSRLQ